MEAAATLERRPGGIILNILGKYTIQWILLLALIVLGALNPAFRQPANLQNILLQSTFTGISAAGMTLLIMSGAFDLSVAGLIGLCGVALAQLMPKLGVAPAILVTVILGAVLGLANGLIVTKARIPAFIATLGMMNIFLTLGFMWTNARVIPATDKAFRSISSTTVFGILPVPFLVMIGVYLISYGILRYTTYGRYIRAVGSNPIASKVTGLPVDNVRIFAFTLIGLFTGLAGVLLTSMLSSANVIMATGFELRVIAVVVVGGTSLQGGQGTLLGSITGALFFSVISNALNMFGVAAYWQYVAVGLILVTALGIEALRSRFMEVARV
ncbi:MAG: ABC transporter permease [Anaerolineae bacterium]